MERAPLQKKGAKAIYARHPTTAPERNLIDCVHASSVFFSWLH